jgi:hypothetical protein
MSKKYITDNDVAIMKANTEPLKFCLSYFKIKYNVMNTSFNREINTIQDQKLYPDSKN